MGAFPDVDGPQAQLRKYIEKDAALERRFQQAGLGLVVFLFGASFVAKTTNTGMTRAQETTSNRICNIVYGI